MRLIRKNWNLMNLSCFRLEFVCISKLPILPCLHVYLQQHDIILIVYSWHTHKLTTKWNIHKQFMTLKLKLCNSHKNSCSICFRFSKIQWKSIFLKMHKTSSLLEIFIKFIVLNLIKCSQIFLHFGSVVVSMQFEIFILIYCHLITRCAILCIQHTLLVHVKLLLHVEKQNWIQSFFIKMFVNKKISS